MKSIVSVISRLLVTFSFPSLSVCHDAPAEWWWEQYITPISVLVQRTRRVGAQQFWAQLSTSSPCRLIFSLCSMSDPLPQNHSHEKGSRDEAQDISPVPSIFHVSGFADPLTAADQPPAIEHAHSGGYEHVSSHPSPSAALPLPHHSFPPTSSMVYESSQPPFHPTSPRFVSHMIPNDYTVYTLPSFAPINVPVSPHPVSLIRQSPPTPSAIAISEGTTEYALQPQLIINISDLSRPSNWWTAV